MTEETKGPPEAGPVSADYVDIDKAAKAMGMTPYALRRAIRAAGGRVYTTTLTFHLAHRSDLEGIPPAPPRPVPVPVTAERRRRIDAPRTQAAAASLRVILGDGWVRLSEVRSRMAAEGYSPGTLYAARDLLMVEQFTRPGCGRCWRLPVPDGEVVVI